MASTTLSRPSPARSIAGWVVSVLLLFAFVFAGAAKVTAQPIMVAEFASFGYPLWFMTLTGLIEIAGAILVVVPRTSRIGSALLACVLAGAILSHLTHGQAAMIGAPVVLLVLAVIAFLLRGGFSAPFLAAKA